MRKIVFFIGIILLLGTSLCFAQAEEITITTYYPSPYGVYNKLTMSTLGVGDIDGDGSPDDDDAPDPATNDGDVWIGGDVGIGTTDLSGNYKLKVNGGNGIRIENTIAAILTLNAGAGTDPIINFDQDITHFAEIRWSDADNCFEVGATGAGYMCLNKGGGNVGIHTTSPAYELDVNGDLRITGTPYRNGGDIAWQVPSDERLKDILGDYEYGLMEIAKINPVRFKFKQDNSLNLTSDKEYVGIIAQEVQKVIPEAVSEEENGYLTLNSSPVIWAMLNAIKQQQKQIDGLKLKIEELEIQLSIR